MVSPEGTLGIIPEEHLPQALEAGFRPINPEQIARIHNRSFLAQKFFEQNHPKLTSFRLPRGKGQW
jgi:hypothetical protein